MIIHFLFYVLYLIVISAVADRYHRKLKFLAKLNKALELPNVNVEAIQRDLTSTNKAIFQLKVKGFLFLGMVLVAHVLFVLAQMYRWWPKLPSASQGEIMHPIGGFLVSVVILTIIFWFKGRGGGVPNNRRDNMFGREPF